MADDDKQAEFAFDLFSDIAPLLALFGDQFARQFTSESLTWLDHLIFAMVPLGILTVITGAIRVQGPRIAKSFIGRGRENRALAEIELMSSTSKEVCEMFNGKSIIRVMGKPVIAQILVFPKDYETLKKTNEEVDQRRLSPDTADDPVANIRNTTNNKAIRNYNMINDNSCGIHTFKTATSQEGARAELLGFEKFHSHSYQVVSRFLRRLTGIKDMSHTAPLNRKDIFKSLGPPNLQLGLSSDQFEPGVPKKGDELFIAALTAIVLQASLIAVASVTVYHERTRRAISFEPKDYGYPCYIAGSILLSAGVAICSLAVERNTVEYDWQVLESEEGGGESAARRKPISKKNARIDESPRLLWLQQSQEVNDQSFGGYAILAGPKYHIITSSRMEDMESMLETGNISGPRRRSRNESDDEDYIPQPIQHTRSNTRTWELITVCAAITAGTGFIVQFMGLRGLTYPCSIAQLVAILLMALVRALIRRRLGREPCHCPAFSRFEIDFLATRIVYCKAFRDFHPGLKDQVPPLNQQRQEEILCWKVKTAKANDEHPFLSNTLRDLRNSYASRGRQQILLDRSELLSSEPASLKRTRNLLATKNSPAQLSIEEASSQQLLRVRERLGDLCKWPSEALESARSLVYSVETFMEQFFPKRLDSLDWVIETIGLSTEPGIGRPDYVSISVQRHPDNGKWQVSIGTIDAILSLWIASIEAQAADARKSSDEGNTNLTPGQTYKSPNWRRTKAGIDLRYDYCRILGDDFEDGSLKRDLSWWVDELIAEQSDARPQYLSTAQDFENDVSPRAGQPSAAEGSDVLDDGWEISDARTKAKENDLIIGFNGRSKDSDPRRLASQKGARELAISSSGHLPNILAQHLFTSFIWTVVEHLPEDCIRQSVMGGEQDVEIEGRHTFDPHEFVDTWRRPTLRHRQLTKLVRQLETFGLGSQTEVLLCMIPAFSFKDLLPNHVILKLIPQIRRGQGWAETARCYNRLLEQGLRVSPHGAMAEEKLCYNVVVATIDFLSFASEPYDEHIKAPDELRDELEDIVARLVSTRFAPVIKKLAQAYILQRRNEDIGRIFGLLGTSDSFERLAGHKQLRRLFDGGHDLDGCLKALRSSEQKPDFPFLEKSLNFSKPHRAIYEALSGRKKDTNQSLLHQFQVDAARTRDIFDWTPLHYASFLKERELLFRYFDPKQVKKHLSLHKELGPFGRSPIHMAAISGSPAALQWISRCLGSKENKRNAYDTTGTDGMSPLHLATKSGHADLAAKIIRKQRLRTTTGLDFWGRAAIHLAASHGHDEIAELLLGEDSQIDTFDEIGKTPLDYLVKIHEELRDAETKDDTQDGEKKDDNCEEETGKEEHDSADADKRDAEDPNPQTAATEGGKLAEQKRAIFVEFAEKSLKNPLHRDKRGKTYLHHAVEHTNIATIEKLLSMGYDLETKDSTGLTPLLFAFAASRPKIALKLLNGFPNLEGRTASALVKDTQENTPLMLAAESGYIDVVRVLIGLSTAKLQGQEGDYPNEDVGPVELSGNYTALKAQGSTYGPLVRNTHGQTALHIALVYGEVEVATYLLHGIDEVQSDPNDGIGNTLLLAAVRNPPVSACIPTIVEKWPSIINQPDSSYGQTPLSWACEAGAESVVDLLLTYEDLDVNKSASNWRNSTPLHFAVGSGRLSIVQKLLSNEKIIVSSKDDSGETAIDRAAKGSDAEIMHELLNHHQIDSTIRLNFLFVTCRVGHPNIQEIVSTVLKQIDDAEITDKDLLELINTSEDLRSSAPYTAFVERAFSRDTWKSMDQPYHKAVRFGSLDYVRRLKEYARDSAEVDEDGWSSIEYANTYRSTNVDAGIVDLLSQQPPQKPELSSLNKPGMLYYPKFANSIQVNACEKPDHGECLCSHIVMVESQHDELERACIRAQHCIPPLSVSNKHFYFEVKVLNDSPSKMLGVGFCNKRYPENEMPGWYQYSWAYHGDDGAIFLNANPDVPWYKKDTPSDDFGANGEYAANDTIGVGLNLETGKGFVTLNGEKRDVGDAFDDEIFKGRKMYPCIGFDSTEEGVGLRFVVNFDGSANHPFEYKGPYL